VRDGGLGEKSDVVLDLAHADGLACRGQKDQDVEPSLVGERPEQGSVGGDVVGSLLCAR